MVGTKPKHVITRKRSKLNTGNSDDIRQRTPPAAATGSKATTRRVTASNATAAQTHHHKALRAEAVRRGLALATKKAELDSEEEDDDDVWPIEKEVEEELRGQENQQPDDEDANSEAESSAEDSIVPVEALRKSAPTTTVHSNSTFLPFVLRQQTTSTSSPSLSTVSETDSTASVAHLEAQLKLLQERNAILQRQVSSVTSIDPVDAFQLLQVRKMVKEDLFKKIKFITTRKEEMKSMTYLSRQFGVKTDDARDWQATCMPYVCDALNNKRNNVAQQLKKALSGMLSLCYWNKMS